MFWYEHKKINVDTHLPKEGGHSILKLAKVSQGGYDIGFRMIIY